MPRKDPAARAEYTRAYYLATKESRRESRRKLTRENKRRFRAKHPEKAAAINRANRIKRMGHTEESLAALLASQNGKCAICPNVLDVPHIDHNHRCCPKNQACSRCVRGLLCRRCNTGLGLFHDDPGLLWAAIQYLTQFPRL